MAATAAELWLVLRARDEASKVVRQFGPDTQHSMGLASTAATAAGVALGNLATNAAGRFKDFAVDSVQSFVHFQGKMNEVFTLMPGMSQAAMDKMTGQVKQFSVDFGVLPEQVIPALYQAISAGVPPDNVFSFLETSQKAAVGGVTDLTTAVNGISSVVNAYGQDVLSAAKASDVMFTGVRLGKTTMDELSKSLFNVVPVASSLKVGFGEVVAALATMTAQGVPTAVATTNLRQALVELSKEGQPAADAFRQMAGIAFPDFIKQGHSVYDALQLMARGAQGSGKNINELFGSVEAGQAALLLTGKGAETFRSNLDQMGQAAGATEKAYQQMQGGVGRSLDQLEARIAVFKVEAGEKLAGALMVAFRGVGDAIAFISSHDEALAATSAVIGVAMVGALTAVTVAAGTASAALIAFAAPYAPLIALGLAVGALAFKVYDLIHAEEQAQAAAAKAQKAMADQAAATDPLIKEWDALVRSGAPLSVQLGDLNNVLRNFQVANQGAMNDVHALTLQIDANHAALRPMYGTAQASTQAFKDLAAETKDLEGKLAGAQVEVRNSQAQIDGLIKKATDMGFAWDGTAAKFVLGAGQARQATQQEQAALDQLNASVHEATQAAIPFGKQIDEIRQKATDVRDAFAQAGKAIDGLTGQMTGAETHLTRQSHALDAVGSAAAAAFSAPNRDAAAQWAQQAKDAADKADISSTAAQQLKDKLDLIAQGGPAAEQALKDVKAAIESQKKPFDDASKAYSDQRQLTGDLAKEQLSLGGTIKDLQKTVQTFVDVFLAQMGTLPTESTRITNEVIAAFQLSAKFQQMGSEAGAAYAAGLRLQAADVARAARQLADGSINGMAVALDAHSPSRKMIKLGGDVVDGFVKGILDGGPKVRDAMGQLVGFAVAFGVKDEAGLAGAQVGDAFTSGFLAHLPTPAEVEARLRAAYGTGVGAFPNSTLAGLAGYYGPGGERGPGGRPAGMSAQDWQAAQNSASGQSIEDWIAQHGNGQDSIAQFMRDHGFSLPGAQEAAATAAAVAAASAPSGSTSFGSEDPAVTAARRWFEQYGYGQAYDPNAPGTYTGQSYSNELDIPADVLADPIKFSQFIGNPFRRSKDGRMLYEYTGQIPWWVLGTGPARGWNNMPMGGQMGSGNWTGQLASAIAAAMHGLSIQVDGRTLGQVVSQQQGTFAAYAGAL